ncbi:hypothetical protein MBM_02816 [Drepanopeziza brunnea f. sp. 'multigermtubi' MB_m1]|uniref:Uncharacterized protein n=1 Tax=Marssonina brunnea f. sp. multigermtubi (strain MB_m1) TaxID=1072389 RepID=K1Y361_MARBU|nr:uncharacterized protein MBM_02816 [Drepanopeziza brunnea f. sp. 'multigermtubi' MB_m1]EKD19579.1 hypothetical protein MBM_02816 [Drepanopeziza brunnea f. sp. 'multigermtubi' MB_m1]
METIRQPSNAQLETDTPSNLAIVAKYYWIFSGPVFVFPALAWIIYKVYQGKPYTFDRRFPWCHRALSSPSARRNAEERDERQDPLQTLRGDESRMGSGDVEEEGEVGKRAGDPSMRTLPRRSVPALRGQFMRKMPGEIGIDGRTPTRGRIGGSGTAYTATAVGGRCSTAGVQATHHCSDRAASADPVARWVRGPITIGFRNSRRVNTRITTPGRPKRGPVGSLNARVRIATAKLSTGPVSNHCRTIRIVKTCTPAATKTVLTPRPEPEDPATTQRKTIILKLMSFPGTRLGFGADELLGSGLFRLMKMAKDMGIAVAEEKRDVLHVVLMRDER